MKRYYHLDLIRFIAALAVIIFHYTFRGYAADNMSPIAFGDFGEIFKYGKYGVELFFMISGYVILMSASGKTAFEFTLGRISRLYPAFWFCVLLTSGVIIFVDNPVFSVSPKQVLLNLTMIPSELGVSFVDGVYWTLLIEIKFYLIIFSILALGLLRWVVPLLYIWLFLAQLSFHFGVPGGLEFFLIDKYACYFIAGCGFYLVKRDGCNIPLVILLLCSFMAALYSFLDLSGFEKHYSTTLNRVVCVTILVSFYAVFIIIINDLANKISRPWMYYGGVITYPVYLLHQNIGFIILNQYAETVNKYALLLGVIGAMLLLSYLVHYYVEIKFGNFFTRYLRAYANKFRILNVPGVFAR